MAPSPFHTHHSDVNRLIITVSAEILLICACIVLFFAYLKLPISTASGLSLVLLLGGSFLCWRSFFSAQLILLFSLLAIEIAIIDFEPNFFFPALIISIFVLGALIFFGGKPRE